jgi:hypothetical protein
LKLILTLVLEQTSKKSKSKAADKSVRPTPLSISGRFAAGISTVESVAFGFATSQPRCNFSPSNASYLTENRNKESSAAGLCVNLAGSKPHADQESSRYLIF